VDECKPLHGGGKRCTIAGCNTPVKLRGLCIRHGGGHTCTVEDCGRSAKARNLCIEHGGVKLCKAGAYTRPLLSSS
jgi:hypothetical protein